jgi:hypothetical protein
MPMYYLLALAKYSQTPYVMEGLIVLRTLDSKMGETCDDAQLVSCEVGRPCRDTTGCGMPKQLAR